MLRTRFGKTGYATTDQHAPKLRQHFRRIRHMVKGIETYDSVHAPVRNVKVMAIEQKELGRRAITMRWLAREQFSADVERRRRYVNRNYSTTQLRQNSRRPTRAGA